MNVLETSDPLNPYLSTDEGSPTETLELEIRI